MSTKKLYDIDAYETRFEAKVLSCEKIEGESVASNTENRYAVILNQTLFFPEEGGQTPDKGVLGGIEVVDVQIKKDVITHYLEAPIKEGEVVVGESHRTKC